MSLLGGTLQDDRKEDDQEYFERSILAYLSFCSSYEGAN